MTPTTDLPHEHEWGYWTGVHGQQTTVEECLTCHAARSATEPTTPTTEAGRRLLKQMAGVTTGPLTHAEAILAIEKQAVAHALAHVAEQVAAQSAYEAFDAMFQQVKPIPRAISRAAVLTLLGSPAPCPAEARADAVLEDLARYGSAFEQYDRQSAEWMAGYNEAWKITRHVLAAPAPETEG